MVNMENDMRSTTFTCPSVRNAAFLAFVAAQIQRCSFPFSVFDRPSQLEVLGGFATLPIAIQRANLAPHGSADILPMFLGKDASRLQPMSATFETMQLDAMVLQALPYDRFANAVFLRDLSHAH
jgi:hypothetical protein